MTSIIITSLIICSIFLLPINGQNYTEKYRLQLHYSVPSGWMNDPNGLIYADGYYNLYFQYDPNSMAEDLRPHWGHAKSTDLIHWENLPIAIYPYEKGTIYSGCCVLDENNVTGFGSHLPGQAEEPLIAIYSLHNVTTDSQTQGLSYSLDQGLTWTYYDDNPIIPNPGLEHFRDPNIFKRYGKFYMILAVFDRVSFYVSENLIKWEHFSDFGEGDKNGIWECPALFTLKDEQNNEHDVLIVSEYIYGGTPKIGGVTQYFIGQFNGTQFNTYNQSRQLWLENGQDNYAAVPYHNDPLGRNAILIGWMSNWKYAQTTPTSTWRGQLTIPRELGLKTVDGNLYLIQHPVDEFYSLIDRSRQWSLSTPYYMFGNQSINLTSQMTFKTGSMFTLDYDINIENIENGEIGLKFSNNLGEFVLFRYNGSSDGYVFDRQNSGNVTFSPNFANRISKAKRINTDNRLWGHIVLDTSAIEIFADDGLNVFTALFFPTEPFENIELIFDAEDTEKTMTVGKLSVSALNSIWI
ncbi:uncharacterized protein LOC116340312 [Contarinia nasturtii]|uniref:uncharacterized protein LOC116340312 n=1 Tax=Contarinia nasturtii TaxID=265458 RepID=UPI0012D41446|nr:uncharacterized protein LOC116340312 [Contarinia nasturtii]